MSDTSGETPGQQPPYGQPTPPGGWPAPPPPPPTQPYPQQPYGYGQPGMPYAGYVAPAYVVPEDRNATMAMIIGIVGLAAGFTLCGVGFIASPFALFLGLGAKRRIDASGGQLGGRGNAQAGFIMGLIGTVLLVLAIIALIGFIVLVVVGISQDSNGFSNGTNA